MVKQPRHGLEQVSEVALRATSSFLWVTLAKRPSALRFRPGRRNTLERLKLRVPGDWAVVRHNATMNNLVRGVGHIVVVVPLRNIQQPTMLPTDDVVILSSADTTLQNVQFSLDLLHDYPLRSPSMTVQPEDVTPTMSELEALASRTAAELRAGTSRLDEELAVTSAEMAQKLATTAPRSPHHLPDRGIE
jgi:hypothetical protein